ncbi:MAG: glycosyl transferase, partial [Acidimicrobiia bacterium]|nr:glycosyl transferase [Acidimicrobiia bacterium]
MAALREDAHDAATTAFIRPRSAALSGPGVAPVSGAALSQVTSPTVAICVVSFQRPVGLARLLHALAALETGRPVSLEVIVVDNDIAGSARTVLDEFRPQAPWPLRYVRQPAQGIPHARNVAVTEAWHADFIAFMDDDEAPL